MQNDMRDRVVELVNSIDVIQFPTENFREHLADYLIANGVFLPPCKVGTHVYFITNINRQSCAIRFGRVCGISVNSIGSLFLDIGECNEFDILIKPWEIPGDEWGKTVFLTREEAEKALQEV